VKKDGVFAERIEEWNRLLLHGHDVFFDLVEAEEGVLTVEDVELEQRRQLGHSYLNVGVFDESECSEFGHQIHDRADVPAQDTDHALLHARVLGGVDSDREGSRALESWEQHPNLEGLGGDLAHADFVQRFA
jgi:hypothetical protein